MQSDTSTAERSKSSQRSGSDADVIVGLLVAAGALLAVSVDAPTLVRGAFLVPTLLVVPGYMAVLAAFPGGFPALGLGERTTAGGRTARLAERFLLAVGGSVALVSTTLIAMLHLGGRLTPISVVTVVGGMTAVFAVLALVRRRRVAPGEQIGGVTNRLTSPVAAWLTSDASFFVVLKKGAFVATVLVAATSVGYAVADAPSGNDTYTEFYLLSENESGELTADSYPTELVVGETESVHVGIENHERRAVNYSVVVELQNVSDEGGESVRLGSVTPTVGAGETWEQRLDIEPTVTGDQLRLTFMLYKGSPPANPTVERAYRTVHLHVSVTEGQR